MMFLVYNLLLTLLTPIWAPWIYLKSRKRKESPNWGQRMGTLKIPPRGERHRIWVHTVSVGEFVAAKPILKELRQTLPNHEIVVSVTTSSGHQTAREAESGLFDHLIYFPIDVARFQLSAMQQVQPDVVAIMETELWMNFLWAAKVFQARTILINGRISDRAFPKAQKVRFYYRALFKYLDLCLVQTETDAFRVRDLGADHVEIMGNSKFDQAANEILADRDKWLSELELDASKPILVVGSTRGEEEEAFVLKALQIVGFDRMQIIHAPRHLERAEALAQSVRKQLGSVALRSKRETGNYLLLDTYGELSSVYSIADVVVVGGGFANLGGQNIIQPLAHGKPVLHGKYMQNFRDIASMADRVGAAKSCESPEALAQEITTLLDDPLVRDRMGKAAAKLVQDNLGASRRYAETIASQSLLAK